MKEPINLPLQRRLFVRLATAPTLEHPNDPILAHQLAPVPSILDLIIDKLVHIRSNICIY